MAMDIVGLIIQLIAGALGGNIAGSALKNYGLGIVGNSIVGVIGGGIGGQILVALLGGTAMPDFATHTAGGGIISNIAGGGIGGAILMVIVGLIRKAMSKSA
jgi:hypothetical protein